MDFGYKKMYKVLISHGIPVEGFAALENCRLVIPEPLGAFTEAEMMDHICDADALVAAGRLSGNVIRAAEKLKVIVVYGAGYDGVDIHAAAQCGIPVASIPDAVSRSTAELAVGLMLSVSRRIGEMNCRLRREESTGLFGMGLHMGDNLYGRTLGLVGCGRIGRRTAEIARALGMRVLAYTPRGAQGRDIEAVELNALLERSDVVSLHCPLTEESRGMIGREAFGRMKPGAIFINTARGGIVDHDALLEALLSGRLSGAGLDVYPDEPQVPEGLLRCERVVCTPHVGANARQTRFEMACACAERIRVALEGGRPDGIVNGL